MKIKKLLASVLTVFILLGAVGCTAPAPTAIPTPTPTTVPTPTPTTVPTPTPTAVPTPTPTTVPTPTPTAVPTPTPTAVPTPTTAPTPTPTAVPTPTPTAVPTPTPTKAPTPTPTPVPTPTPKPVPSLKPSGVSLSYKTYPAPADDPIVNAGGTNLAFGRPVTVSGVFRDIPHYTGANATDGNTATIWASDEGDTPWVQIDLGSAMRLGRVEVVARPDGDNSHERVNLAVLVSNDPTFTAYTTVATRETYSFEAYGEWIVNTPAEQSYRYVRVTRINKAGHFTVSEVRVFDKAADYADNIPDVLDPYVNGSTMLINRTGKALSVKRGVPCVISYDFANTQQWIKEPTKDGWFRLRNGETNQYLAVKNGALTLSANAAAGSEWYVIEAEACWGRVVNELGGILCTVDGALAYSNISTDADTEWWYVGEAYTADIPKGDTSYLNNGYGVMYHLLPDSATVRNMSKRIDINGIASDLAEVKASYFMLALGQNSGYYNTPNATFGSIVSTNSDKRFTATDIPMQFYDELSKRGIDLMFYFTTTLPSAIEQDYKDFYMETYPKHNRDSAMLWSLVMREWSLRYGDKVKGWWMDGGYFNVVTDEKIFLIMSNGIKAGNPNAIIAYNPGVIVAERASSDEYTCGEIDWPFGTREYTEQALNDRSKWVTPQNVPIKEKAWFTLTFLDNGWCHNTSPREQLYDGTLWGEYVKTVLNQNGGICLDVDFKTTTYRMNSNMKELLIAIHDTVYP